MYFSQPTCIVYSLLSNPILANSPPFDPNNPNNSHSNDVIVWILLAVLVIVALFLVALSVGVFFLIRHIARKRRAKMQAAKEASTQQAATPGTAQTATPGSTQTATPGTTQSATPSTAQTATPGSTDAVTPTATRAETDATVTDTPIPPNNDNA